MPRYASGSYSTKYSKRPDWNRKSKPPYQGKDSATFRKNVKDAVQAIASPEKKYNYGGFSNVEFNAYGVFTELWTVAQGLTDYERIGDTIHLTSLQYDFQFKAATSTGVVRIIFFQWNRPGTTPTLDLMISGTTGTNKTSGFFIHDALVGRQFQILMDKKVSLTNSGDNQIVFCKGYCPLRYAKKDKHFVAGGTTASTNSYWLWIGSDSTSPGDGPVGTGNVLQTYTDM